MIRILIVDNHPIVRTGLELFLNSKPDLEVVGKLSSGIEIFEFVRRHQVDVIISEIDLPELNGITALRAIKKENKSVNVLMFSHQPEEIYAISTLKAGASGYLNKAADVDAIETAVRKIHGGEVSLSEKMDKHLPLIGSCCTYGANQKPVFIQFLDKLLLSIFCTNSRSVESP